MRTGARVRDIRWAVGAFLCGLTLSLATPVAGNNFGSTASPGEGDSPSSSVNLDPNSHHTIRFFYIETLQRNATEWGLGRIDQSLMSTQVLADTTCSACTSQDVLITDGNYGDNGVVAWNSCPGTATVTGVHPERTCYGQIVRYNNGAYPEYYNSTLKRYRLGCHELGHTVGLRHNEFDTAVISCLNRYVRTSNDFTAHDLEHLNFEYG